MADLGWQSLGVLELTALPSLDEQLWVPLVRETDVLLAGGGDAVAPWIRSDRRTNHGMGDAARRRQLRQNHPRHFRPGELRLLGDVTRS